MGMKKVYTCDICKCEMPEIDVAGFWFGTHEHEPKLISPILTENVHLCTKCMPQLRFALNNRLPDED
jgi:hypothetical protein